MINPDLHAYFEMLPIDVKNYILQSDSDINTLTDLCEAVDEILNG